ncbi:phosphate ABC transporter ATP-binding protein PstB [uncultured Mycolicibacterium sp.]|uniref:phosphate ABC transporter ATP-binding protein PstB n=1 Tax=uncultured Mycolicibacterium sp. TaxID=2320817 RepID=UPI0032B2D4B0|tara:strand:- start:294 stop:1217 length:924 start_codon:yes stop_codon:yes gene_type:complete
MTDKTTAPATQQTGEEERPAVQALPSVEETARESREQRGEPQSETERETLFSVEDLTVRYGKKPAVEDVTFDIYKNNITALIGPSGCGKSTLIRCFNRMNDLIPAASIEGHIRYHGQDLYDPSVDAVEVRKRIGMVFQAPNPFPKSIFENIAFGPRVLGTKKKSDLDDIVEEALTRAALWDDVKDRLDDNAYGMSGGQQQRLCIARSIATKPDVVLMDEPCSALDPISTGKIEDLMMELKKDYSIIVVTHNMQQAARVSDMTAFLMVQLDDDEENPRGRLVEYSQTDKIFTNPSDERTEQYVSGRVG